MIRVVLVDDHPVVRVGVRALLESQADLSVVGEATTREEAVLLVRATEPDVVLMDLNLAGGATGTAATLAVRALPNPPQVLVLTTYGTESDVLAAIDAGAVGYLLKDAPPEELFHAVRSTARGETTLSPSVASILMRRSVTSGSTLTLREIEIVTLLADGLANRVMARRLMVSEATVKSHLSHIYTKLGVDTRAGAVAKAIELRIIRT